MIVTRDKKGRFIKGHEVPEEFREASRKYHTGAKRPQSWKNSISKGNSGKKRTPEHRLNLDGYCPSLNLAIEINEPHHKNRVEKNQLKEEDITTELKCNYLTIEVPRR